MLTEQSVALSVFRPGRFGCDGEAARAAVTEAGMRLGRGSGQEWGFKVTVTSLSQLPSVSRVTTHGGGGGDIPRAGGPALSEGAG